ncbi:thioredoxin [bacterium]|nr:thioredoxin [FCB group bacterium]MBL7190763.1 thioredoxin [bacterium]
MSQPIELTDSNFETEVLKSDLPVLVDFWAGWCMPCKMVAPSVLAIAEEYDGKLKVGKVDVDSNQGTAANFSIRSIPTLMLFKGGKMVDSVIGAVPKEMIVQVIKKHL